MLQYMMLYVQHMNGTSVLCSSARHTVHGACLRTQRSTRSVHMCSSSPFGALYSQSSVCYPCPGRGAPRRSSERHAMVLGTKCCMCIIPDSCVVGTGLRRV